MRGNSEKKKTLGIYFVVLQLIWRGVQEYHMGHIIGHPFRHLAAVHPHQGVVHEQLVRLGGRVVEAEDLVQEEVVLVVWHQGVHFGKVYVLQSRLPILNVLCMYVPIYSLLLPISSQNMKR